MLSHCLSLARGGEARAGRGLAKVAVSALPALSPLLAPTTQLAPWFLVTKLHRRQLPQTPRASQESGSQFFLRSKLHLFQCNWSHLGLCYSKRRLKTVWLPLHWGLQEGCLTLFTSLCLERFQPLPLKFWISQERRVGEDMPLRWYLARRIHHTSNGFSPSLVIRSPSGITAFSRFVMGDPYAKISF